MVNPGIVAVGLGAVFALIGWLGLTGRLLRSPSSNITRNFGAQILFGSALVGMGLIVLLKAHQGVVALLALATVALLLMGVWASFVRAPRWLRPRFPLDRDETTGGTDR